MIIMTNRYIKGVVTKGASRGCKMGFPTANILPPKGAILPDNGVYRTKVTLDGNTYNAITNIGINPTFGSNQKTVESHIFDFGMDIVGEEINIEIISFVRAERMFDNIYELVKQIKSDVAQVLAEIEESVTL